MDHSFTEQIHQCNILRRLNEIMRWALFLLKTFLKSKHVPKLDNEPAKGS